MDKNWLIRTKSNHILGPVSKEKVLELFQNGSLKSHDEVCSGNGFWFFLREEDMVDRYLLGNEKQNFNPLSEAKDILTAKDTDRESSEEDLPTSSPDITLVGNINLESLNEDIPPASLPPEVEVDTPPEVSKEEALPSEEQKKNKPKLRTTKKTKKKLSAPTKNHSYLKYLFLLILVLLLSLTYYRKQVIRFLFDGEMTHFHLISPVYAQAEFVETSKKNFLEDRVLFDGVSFWPEIGLNGFNVISSLDLPSFQCEKLKSDTFRLAFLLFPTDRFNEKFLIKIRECATEETDNKIFTNWLKSIDTKPALTKSEQKNRSLLTQVLNSPYNLVTDLNLKANLTNILIDMPQDTLSETLLKSWLFLMLGNITRSDNLLRDFINTPPYYNWKKSSVSLSFYHTLGVEFLDGIIEKLSKHPSDRLIFKLFCEYIISYYSDATLLYKIRKVHSGLDNLDLEYVKRASPALVNHLRLKSMPENERMKVLKASETISRDEQSLWHWPFFYMDPLISDAIYPTLKQWEKADELWFIYLMSSEKMIDLWSKNSGKSFIHGRRQFLRKHLEGNDFTLSLYQLIKLGDIDNSLIETVHKHRAQ